MFAKIFFWTFLLSAYILFIGRNNVYLGSALYFLEYPYLLIGGYLLWREWKQPKLAKRLRISLLFIVLLFGGDTLYLLFNKQKSIVSQTETTEMDVMTYNLLFTNATYQKRELPQQHRQSSHSTMR